ncbi:MULTISPECIES: acetyltransferase [unclassified Halomonas]|uniref:acetyltransferase n=1 Tax=unclassified Halomonas TaxID=2609666 RepID=UPI0009907F95|nr:MULTISPECIES: acetyltransferase [unclassified Halomonas]AQU82741.1 acetyltransferase [Halomonas sp. 'Soap Lake \
MKIENVKKSDYPQLLEIWEASVRATHDFLAEEDLQELKPLILEHYFDAVELNVAKSSESDILGFCGVSDGNIEMLFISPTARGKGIGLLLATHAIKTQGATKVDVNEQNEQALGFYKHIGFSVAGRSPLDGQGKPYPLLHMELSKKSK